MQTAFPRAVIADNLVHPISSTPACNRITPIVMERRPYAGISPLLPFLEKEEALALTDARDQTRCWKRSLISIDILPTRRAPMRQGPLHFPLENGDAYKNEDKRDSLLRLIFEYLILFAS